MRAKKCLILEWMSHVGKVQKVIIDNYNNLLLDKLTIMESQATLESFSIWGMLRGLESFSQLLYVAPDARSVNDSFSKMFSSIDCSFLYF